MLVHGGVHGDFETSYAHIVRELMEQGYVVLAPEYRGSTGYGDDIYDQIDYGAYAGVPVSDLVERMGYQSKSYRNIFADFIGKQAVDDPAEYKRRSPAFQASKLATPLLVHTNTNVAQGDL